MELVNGVPITKFCDDHKFSLPQRLELFKAVCEAVQHAHQKGIIHRDIKPTNVLVAEYDNRAVPKIIDFGVAKATAQKLTERTMFTEFGQVIGTFEYMSPEQAKLNQLDVDTRSDIYSLGVLLYELLTGSTPFEGDRLREAAFDEVLRIIREEEPPKPSTRLSTSDTLPSIAASRRTEPARLSKDLHGELDWIVMKCLEKDRSRRYETASSLALDLQRHLTDQPVEACPPSAAYRMKKFVRRNKAGVFAGAAILTALVAGLGAASYFGAVASREARVAKAALTKAEESRQEAEGVNDFFVNEVFALADPYSNQGRGLTMVEALDIAAEKIDDKFPNDPALRAMLYLRISGCYTNTQQMAKGVVFGEKGIALLRQVYGEDSRELLKYRSYFGRTLSRNGRQDEGRALLEEVWAAQRRLFGDGDPDTVDTATRLAMLLMVMRPSDESRPEEDRVGDRDLEVAQTAYDAALRELGPRHPATLHIEGQLSWILRWHGRLEEALRYGKEAAELQRIVVGETDTGVLYARYNYACILSAVERYDEAIEEFQEIWNVRRKVLGPGHSDTLWAAFRLIQALQNSGRREGAAETLKALSKDMAAIRSGTRADPLPRFAEMARELGEPAIAEEFEKAVKGVEPPAADKAHGQLPNEEPTTGAENAN
jgi:non-specific serine/threonine protein kinase/serine/threonine-protein kinase